MPKQINVRPKITATAEKRTPNLFKKFYLKKKLFFKVTQLLFVLYFFSLNNNMM